MENSALSQEISELHADICSALADPCRILILYLLAEKRLNVSDLAREIGVSQPTASRHLKLLREPDLVRPVRQGTIIEYHLTNEGLINAPDILRAVMCDRIHYRASLLAMG